MKTKLKLITLLWLMMFIAACSSKVSSTGGNATAHGKYSEDLSVLRPKETITDTSRNANTVTQTTGDRKTEYVEAKFAVNEKLDVVLDSISKINHSNGFIDGFTIQIYSGIKREEALNVKKELSTKLPQLDSDVQYVQPNFRVRAGKYYDRLTAQRDYLEIKRHFPNAIVIPDRIPISQK